MGSPAVTHRFAPVLQVVLLALAYYVAGRLALLMAIAPGYATPVWPAAGVALAGLLKLGNRAWPGVLAGSFLINLPTALGALSPGAAALTSLALAAGATAQALAGAALVRWLADQSIATAQSARIAALLTLAGPLACLVSASVGVATLWSAGLLSTPDLAFHGFTWWVGDTIGVLVVMPVYLAWTTPEALLTRRNKVLATLPVLVLTALVTLLFVRTSAMEQQRLVDEFRQRSDRIAHTLNREFAEYTEVLHAIAGFQTVSTRAVDRDEFRRLVADMLVRHPGLYGLSWAPRVAGGQRAAYERQVREEGFPGFTIRELSPRGTLVPAGTRREYYPVTFMEPLQRNVRALGFDVGSEPVRRAMLQRAGAQGGAVASGRIQLVQAGMGGRGVLVVVPAYWPGMPLDTPAQREQALRGFAGAALQLDDMMAMFLRGLDTRGLRVRLVDAAAPGGQARLPDGGVALQRVEAQGLRRDVPLDVGGKPWRLEFTSVPDFASSERTHLAWSVLAAGLLFTALFSAFLLVTIGRTAAVEALVHERTAELSATNAALARSLDGLARSEDALRQSELDARAIVDTARDAYVCMDPDGRVTGWNGEAERVFGWSRAQALGRPLHELIAPANAPHDDAAALSRLLADAPHRPLDLRTETLAQHRDGRSFPVELTLWTTRNGDAHRVHAFLHDISARRRAAQRLAAQEAVAAALVESPGLSEAAPRVLRSVCDALGWCVGAVWVAQAGADTLACCEYYSRTELDSSEFEQATRTLRLHRGEGLPGRAWAEGRPLGVADVAREALFVRRGAAAAAGLHAGFALPMVGGDEVLGVVEFFTHQVEEADDGLLAMMGTLGSLLGQFVARRRAEAALHQEKERAEVTLNSIGDGVVVIDTDGRITYLNPVAQAMTGWGADAVGHAVSDVVRIVDVRSGEAARNPLLDAMRENRPMGLATDSELLRRDGQRAAIEDSAAPIHDREGRVTGAVMVFHDISEARAMALKMSHLAQHDYLTDLPNRVLLQDRFAQAIARARRERGRLALLYTDLDGFKHINDSLGHEVGDQLLKEVAARLARHVRGADTVSRQGGDEFVILLPQVRSAEDAAQVAENLLAAVRAPFRIGGAELHVTMSIGISLYPDDGDEAGALLKYADAAMYEAKQHGRNQHRFYTRAFSERADRRLQIESLLHQALRDSELELHYQPKVQPETGAITGMEALVRWQPAGGPPVPPDEFIDIAEETGLITRIDEWVLEQACRQNREWQRAGLICLPVAVNLSAAQTNAEHYPAFVSDVLARTGLAAQHLQIEITESQMLRDTGRFDTLIRGIKAVGVRVAIDDFGTGYSSLGYLRRFSFDVLKIDRSFVHSLTDEHNTIAVAIVEAITRMARALGYVVVAEGVETAAQARILVAHGCHEMQGYLYGRPMPAREFEGVLRAGHVGAWHGPVARGRAQPDGQGASTV